MKKNQVIFCTIKGSTIKKFLIIECITGTGIYYAIKIIASSIIIGIIGSMIGTETIKRVTKYVEKRSILSLCK